MTLYMALNSHFVLNTVSEWSRLAWMLVRPYTFRDDAMLITNFRPATCRASMQTRATASIHLFNTSRTTYRY